MIRQESYSSYLFTLETKVLWKPVNVCPARRVKEPVIANLSAKICKLVSSKVTVRTS